MRLEVLEVVRALVVPILEREGFELVDLKLGGVGKGRVLRIFIHRPGGVSLDDCVRISRMVEDRLDMEDPIPGSYTLEVSSPGLDRPLRTGKDFARVVGERVRLIMRAGVRPGVVVGKLVRVGGDHIAVETGEGVTEVPLRDVAQGKVEVL
ncbi:MAG TPA: ribosome maturation factor RimP [Candidatus Latescibacteria bacterium]|nr:ribosome maturation factor RimP [Candidatus Latescibacterota bacterium]